MTSRMRLKRKEVDDVLGGDEMWAHADRTQGMNDLPPCSSVETYKFFFLFYFTSLLR